jgi:hypothetical protein
MVVFHRASAHHALAPSVTDSAARDETKTTTMLQLSLQFAEKTKRLIGATMLLAQRHDAH